MDWSKAASVDADLGLKQGEERRKRRKEVRKKRREREGLSRVEEKL